MIQKLIHDLGGIGIFGTISVCLFFLVFGGALFWALRLKKPFLKTMESLPLQDGTAALGKEGEPRHE